MVPRFAFILLSLAGSLIASGTVLVKKGVHKQQQGASKSATPVSKTGSKTTITGGEPSASASNKSTNSDSPPNPRLTSPDSENDAARLPRSANQCPSLPPLESFVRIAAHTRPQVSPDGSLYFISDMRETPQLFVLDGPQKWPRQLTFFTDGLAFFSVSPDGKKILFATDDGGNEQYGITLFDVATGRLSALTADPSSRVESFSWAPTSDWFAFTSNARNKTDFDLYRFELKTGKSSLLSELSGHHSVVDISPDQQHISLNAYRSVTDSSVLIYSSSGSKSRPAGAPPGKLTVLLEDADAERSNSDAHFTADSQSVYLLSDRDQGIHQVFLVQLTDPLRAKTITSGPYPVESVGMDRGRTAIAYHINRQGLSDWGGFEIDGKGRKTKSIIFPLPQRQNSPHENVVNSFYLSRLKGKLRVFFAASHPAAPSEIAAWTHPTLTRWTQPVNEGLASECYAPATMVSYPSFDGTEIPAFLYSPRHITSAGDAPAAATPFLIYVHGGPEAQFRPTFNKTFQYFLSRGFGILAPNIRGSTGYGRDYTLKDNYKKRMDSVQDVIKGAEWLVKNELATKRSIGIFGGSYGGFLVLRSIQLAPEIFAAASESVGITNFVSFLKNTKSYRRVLREREYGPLADEAFLSSISPISYLAQIKTPLQIFHGANDPRVPVSESEQLASALKARNIPVELRIFPDEGHGNHKLKNILEQTKLMAYFFEQHLNQEKGPSSK